MTISRWKNILHRYIHNLVLDLVYGWGDNYLTERKRRFRKIGGYADPCVRKRRDNETTLNNFVNYYNVFLVFFLL